ncbi:hypothetical protein [Prochlorococcus marinus]|uniref:Lipoprotein n=1 Tax=Prochlorococcus marinus XMU1408 TaxID=2213228 RepID=A0A318R6V9_PROMR|nr:hypothetical protein [Prochlorococcus marinus]MBW3042383.1 hypothetical protein [Prochlorococcus marinus str. XMU1408]PYE01118.1 hypothetical protein DNJ73_06725 [Prochlorococcus marinus XMU1408]
MKKVLSKLAIAGFILISTACSGGGGDTSKKVTDPCRDDASEQIGKVEEYQNEENETLRGIRTHTKRKVVLMPVSAAGGGGGGFSNPMMMGGGGGAALAPFATEIMNQAFLNEGIKTVAWFKVSKELKRVLGQGADNSSPYAQQMQQMQMMQGGGGQSLVNDNNLNELIDTARNLGACYVVRPVILKASNTKDSKSSGNALGVALGVSRMNTTTNSNAEVDIKISIISTREELDNPIIAIKTFSGRSVQVSKERANVLDGITGGAAFGGGSNTNQTKIAFYDTIDKIVEFLEDKMI